MKDNSPSSHGPEPASPRHIVREIEHHPRPLGDYRAPEAAIAVNTGLDHDGERLEELVHACVEAGWRWMPGEIAAVARAVEALSVPTT